MMKLSASVFILTDLSTLRIRRFGFLCAACVIWHCLTNIPTKFSYLKFESLDVGCLFGSEYNGDWLN